MKKTDRLVRGALALLLVLCLLIPTLAENVGSGENTGAGENAETEGNAGTGGARAGCSPAGQCGPAGTERHRDQRFVLKSRKGL